MTVPWVRFGGGSDDLGVVLKKSDQKSEMSDSAETPPPPHTHTHTVHSDLDWQVMRTFSFWGF